MGMNLSQYKGNLIEILEKGCIDTYFAYITREDYAWSTGEIGPIMLPITYGYLTPFVPSVISNMHISFPEYPKDIQHNLSRDRFTLGGIDVVDIISGRKRTQMSQEDIIVTFRYACSTGNFPIMKCLIDKVDINNIEFLQYACREGRKDVVQYLFDNGMNISLIGDRDRNLIRENLIMNSREYKGERYTDILRLLTNKGMFSSNSTNMCII